MTAPPTALVRGLGLPESVRCDGSGVWFSDWTAGAVHRLDLATGQDEVVARVESLPLCFDLDVERLVVLDSRTGTLLRGRRQGPLEPWTDVSGVSRGAGNEVLAVGDHTYVLDFGNFDPREGSPHRARRPGRPGRA